ATPEFPEGEDRRYGAQLWLWDDEWGTFAAQGYEGQRIIVVPGLDLVVVRLGKTPAPLHPNLREWLEEVLACCATPSPAIPFARAWISKQKERLMAGSDVLDNALEGFSPLDREQAERIVHRLVAEGRLAQERAEDAVEELVRRS